MIVLVPTFVETANRHDRFKSDKAKLQPVGVNDFHLALPSFRQWFQQA